jgi:predicted RNA-binding Zn-ribbon protein involved in translation (DUF1610 family)
MGSREFMVRYGLAESCGQALFAWRRAREFVCPECGHTGYCALKTRQLIQCNGCRRQTSVTAGTIFANSKLQLNIWFLAMHLITQAKNGITSLQLSRQLAISQDSAWLMAGAGASSSRRFPAGARRSLRPAQRCIRMAWLVSGRWLRLAAIMRRP